MKHDVQTTETEIRESAKVLTRAIEKLICESCGSEDDDVEEYDSAVNHWDYTREQHYTTGRFVNFCNRCAK